MNKILKKTLPYVAAGMLAFSPNLKAQVAIDTTAAQIDTNAVQIDAIETYDDILNRVHGSNYPAVLDSTANQALDDLAKYNESNNKLDSLFIQYNNEKDSLNSINGQMESTINNLTTVVNNLVTDLGSLRNREDPKDLVTTIQNKPKEKVEYRNRLSLIGSDKYLGLSFDLNPDNKIGLGLEGSIQYNGLLYPDAVTTVLDSVEISSPIVSRAELYEITKEEPIGAGKAIFKLNYNGKINASLGAGTYINWNENNITKGVAHYGLDGTKIGGAIDQTKDEESLNFKPLLHVGLGFDLGKYSVGASYNHNLEDETGEYMLNLGVKLGKK